MGVHIVDIHVSIPIYIGDSPLMEPLMSPYEHVLHRAFRCAHLNDLSTSCTVPGDMLVRPLMPVPLISMTWNWLRPDLSRVTRMSSGATCSRSRGRSVAFHLHCAARRRGGAGCRLHNRPAHAQGGASACDADVSGRSSACLLACPCMHPVTVCAGLAWLPQSVPHRIAARPTAARRATRSP